MRKRKAIINSTINIIAAVFTLIPSLIIRNIFLNTLGEDLLGLNSLYSNIIGWLSIFELGVGTAIIFSLYKPFAENNRKKIRAYISFYKKFYRNVGIIILVIGILITPFLHIFIKGNINSILAQVGFILFLLNTFITYIFSSKLCILNVAQESYKVTIGTTISKFATVLIQIVLLKIYPNFIIYCLIQLLINLLYYILINIYIANKYPWLNEERNRLEKREEKELLKNVKALFMHKIGSLVVFSTDNLLISTFIGLGALAKYTNYYTIISNIQMVISRAFAGLTASVGNLLTEDNNEQSKEVHKKMFFANFWIVAFIVISLYNTLDQFIVLWVGERYILDRLTFIVILINLYFVLMRGSIERFKEGSGNFYKDRYAPLAEAFINLVSSLLLVKYIGLAGVFIGTLISNFIVVFWVQPYIVYKYVFKEKVIKYFIMYFKYAMLSMIPLMITSFLTKEIKVVYTINSFIVNCLINIVIINTIFIIIFYKTNELKYFKNIVKNILKNKLGKNRN